MVKDLIIVGASGMGREVLQWCKDINAVEKRWNIRGFLDDDPNALDRYACDFPVLGGIDGWIPNENQEFVVALLFPEIKKRIVQILSEKKASFTSVIHSDAKTGSFNKFGKGIILYPNSRITVNAVLGDFVTVLDNTTIGHDAILGSYSSVCGGCGINGKVVLEEGVLVASHSTIAPGCRIGKNAFIGAGSSVVANIRANKRVLGVPARKINL